MRPVMQQEIPPCSSLMTMSDQSSQTSNESHIVPMFPAMCCTNPCEIAAIQPSSSSSSVTTAAPDPLGPSLFCSEDFDKTEDDFSDEEELLEVTRMKKIPRLESVPLPPPVPPLQPDVPKEGGCYSPPQVYWGYPASPGYGSPLPLCPVHRLCCCSYQQYHHSEPPPIFFQPNSAWLGSPQRCNNSAFSPPQCHHHPGPSMHYISCSPIRNPLTESPRLFPPSPVPDESSDATDCYFWNWMNC